MKVVWSDDAVMALVDLETKLARRYPNRLFKDWPKVFPDAADEELNLIHTPIEQHARHRSALRLRSRARARVCVTPSRRRTVLAPPGGPWAPVMPVDLVPTPAGGDRLAPRAARREPRAAGRSPLAAEPLPLPGGR